MLSGAAFGESQKDMPVFSVASEAKPIVHRSQLFAVQPVALGDFVVERNIAAVEGNRNQVLWMRRIDVQKQTPVGASAADSPGATARRARR